jgi:DNA-binding transcriptional MerR regulator
MRIGDAAAAVGLTPRALRYYEQRGLISVGRAPSGHREYGPRDLRRLRAVRDLLEIGLTIEDVRTLLGGLDRPAPQGGPCVGEVVLRQRLAELDARIGRLTRLRDSVAAQLGRPGVFRDAFDRMAGAEGGGDLPADRVA